MSKDYLKKLLKYMKEVYHIEDAIKHLKDPRIKPKYSAAFMSLIGKEPRLIIDFEMYKGTEDSSKRA